MYCNEYCLQRVLTAITSIYGYFLSHQLRNYFRKLILLSFTFLDLPLLSLLEPASSHAAQTAFVGKKVTDAKNFIRDFIRSRTALNCGKNCFKKECCTLAIFRSEVEIFFSLPNLA